MLITVGKLFRSRCMLWRERKKKQKKETRRNISKFARVMVGLMLESDHLECPAKLFGSSIFLKICQRFGQSDVLQGRNVSLS